MKDSKPLVSIGMPVYNEEQYIAQALDSLLAQSFKDFELIISDNASTDGTWNILQDYAAQDPHIFLHRQSENRGGAANFQFVWDQVRGEYFMLAGGHDLWDKTFISRCTEILTNDPLVVLCYSQTMLVDLEGNELGIMSDRLDTRSVVDASQRFHRIIWELTWCNMVYGLIRSSALRKTRLAMPVIGADNLLLAELSLMGTFAQIPLPLFYRRQNRPGEGGEQMLRRRLEAIAPNMNVTIPYSLLMFQHLVAVKNAPLSLQDKLKLIADVLHCFFKNRFGALDELLRAVHLFRIYRYVRKTARILLLHLGLR